MIDLEVIHSFLVSSQDDATGKNRVLRFFEKTTLVQYDSIEIIHENCCPATETTLFWEKIEERIAANRQLLAELVGELDGVGFRTFRDFMELSQTEGFPSKTLHVIAHLLDGFFGVDSHFYNLEEESHWISDTLRESIRSSPESMWYIEARARNSN
ncbi:hypothetical protein ACFL6N_05130 [Thermodesulfobacteriota bacterium]